MTFNTKSSPTIAKALEKLLDTYGYPYECVDDFDFRFHIRTADGTWRTQVQCYESAKLVRVYMYLNDAPFPSSRVDFVREAVERLNGTIVAGRFVWDRGQVRYENGIDFYDRRRSLKAIERALRASSFPLALWNHIVGLIDKPTVDARKAVDYALFMEKAVEDANSVNTGTIELALKVVEGGGGSVANAEREKPTLTLMS